MKKKVLLLCCAILLACIGLLFAACGSDGATSIANLTYNGETITWSSVRNAKNYKITIDGGENIIVSQTEGTVTYRYDAGGEDFDFTIEAVIKEGSDKNPVYSLRFENIGQVGGLKMEAGKLTWNALDTADKYEIMYNGDIVASDVGATEYAAKEGAFTYRVRARKGVAENTDGNNPYYSVWSEPLSGTVLPAPKDLAYDSEYFTWEKVEGAASYTVKIGNEENAVQTNRFAYPAPDSDFRISVTAHGNPSEDIYDSAPSAEKQYRYIAPIEGLDVVEGVLKWTVSENAVRYKIKINDTVNNEELTSNEYAALSSGSSYRIQILPIGTGDFWFSRWSEEITINILRSPAVSFGDNVIRWNQVTGCSGYQLKIEKDGEVVHTDTAGVDTFVYNYAFPDAGEYFVYVRAEALGTGGVYGSKYSTGYSVRRLATPSNAKVTNRPLEDNQVSVTFTPAVGASSHILRADGVQIAETNSGGTFSVDISQMTDKTTESVVKFQIAARGSVTTQGAVLDSAVPLEFTVTKLATPQNLQISGNQLSWSSVNNTSKYVLTIDGHRTQVTTNSYTFTDLAAGGHDIYVQAMGDGESVITGSFSNLLEVDKLAKPSNLNIENGNLTWGSVQKATAYKVILGTDEYDANTTAFSLTGYLSSINEGTGTQISVYAVGNGTDIINSDVSDTRTISKYARPSAIKLSGDNLVWNPSALNGVNCNSYKLIIDGKPVFVTGASYSLSKIAAGDHTVKVVALGDNAQTLDSPESDAYSFTKLAAISSVRRENGMFVWDEIAGAVRYEIKLSQDATWTSVSTNSYKPKYSNAGEYSVSIRAAGGGGNVADSELHTFTQKVSALTQPANDQTMQNGNAFKVEVERNTITVTVKKQSGAAGYKCYIGGSEVNGEPQEMDTEVVFTYTMTTPNAKYAVQVQILGGYFAENGTYMLDSNPSTEYTVEYNP